MVLGHTVPPWTKDLITLRLNAGVYPLLFVLINQNFTVHLTLQLPSLQQKIFHVSAELFSQAPSLLSAPFINPY